MGISSGLLRHQIEFLTNERVLSASGAYQESLISNWKTRCYIKSFIGKMEEVANELQNTYDYTVIVRRNIILNDKMQVIFQGNRFNIISLEDNLRNNSMTVRIKKIDL